jgi:hypothetical protein
MEKRDKHRVSRMRTEDAVFQRTKTQCGPVYEQFGETHDVPRRLVSTCAVCRFAGKFMKLGVCKERCGDEAEDVPKSRAAAIESQATAG